MAKNQRGLASVTIVLVVVALFAGGILAWQYFKAPEGKETPEVKTSEQVVSEFYQGYLKAADCGPRRSCAQEMKEYIKNSNILEKSYQNIVLDKEAGFLLIDPILWAQDVVPVDNFQVHDAVVLKDKSASVIVTFLPMWPKHRVKVYLVLEDQEWKINDIENVETGQSKVNLPSMRIKIEDETANWKTYRNEEYGFEVKYPEDWLLVPGKTYSEEIKLHIGFCWPELWPQLKNCAMKEGKGGIMQISLYISDPIPLDRLYQIGDRMQKITDGEEIIVGGVKAYYFRELRSPDEPSKIPFFDDIFFLHKGHFFQIRGYLFDPYDTYKKVFKQILSTFRFLE